MRFTLAVLLLSLWACHDAGPADEACRLDYNCRMNRAPDDTGDCNGYYSATRECNECRTRGTCVKEGDGGVTQRGTIAECNEVCATRR